MQTPRTYAPPTHSRWLLQFYSSICMLQPPYVNIVYVFVKYYLDLLIEHSAGTSFIIVSTC